ncbi:acid protease [Gigaspora margarita]|uniref:Acid protease n=1 Tax=Gigaspora margarita TaxID=4874 RepID=A0A8H4EK86_GIGMA|nr:acid protease [Gigaspora margarita]
MIVNCILVVRGISVAAKYKKYKRNNLNSHNLFNRHAGTLRSDFKRHNLYQKFSSNSFVANGFKSQNIKTQKNTKNGLNIQVYSNPMFGSYALQMEIGGQTFTIVIDTLAPTFWVQGNKCRGTFCSIPFDPSNATSFYDTGKRYNDKFYTISGEIAASDINISGEKAKNVFFNLIDTEVGPFPGSGVIGMGHNPFQGYPITNSTPNPIFALYKQKAIKKKLYSLYLGSIPDPFREPNATVEQSLLTLGEIDTTLYTGNINYFSVKDKNFWEIDLDDVIVNGKKLGIKGHKIILDAGFPNILMPSKYSTKINKLVPEAKLLKKDYMFPCNTNATVSFVIGGVEYKINSKDLVNGYYTSDPEHPPDGWCMSAIYGFDDDDKKATWHLGGTFFRSIYAVFDYENSKVGIAQAAPRKN